MNAILNLHDNQMSDEGMQELTFELKNSLNQETDLTAQLPEEAGGLGTKGDAVTIGQIILAAVGGGGAIAALMPVLKAYVERKPTLRIKIENADGSKMTLVAEHFNPGQIEQTTRAVQQLCESSKDNGGSD
jgi:alkylation response protein AidB-like acyl-CoA dehydrogenase